MEEINKTLKESQEKNNQLKEMSKTVPDIKMEKEAIKEIQIEGILQMKNLFFYHKNEQEL